MASRKQQRPEQERRGATSQKQRPAILGASLAGRNGVGQPSTPLPSALPRSPLPRPPCARPHRRGPAKPHDPSSPEMLDIVGRPRSCWMDGVLMEIFGPLRRTPETPHEEGPSGRVLTATPPRSHPSTSRSESVGALVTRSSQLARTAHTTDHSPTHTPTHPLTHTPRQTTTATPDAPNPCSSSMSSFIPGVDATAEMARLPVPLGSPRGSARRRRVVQACCVPRLGVMCDQLPTAAAPE